MGRRAPVVVGLLAALVVAVAGCGVYTDPSPSSPEPTGATATPTSETVPSQQPEEAEEATATPPTESELPGEAVQGYPAQGDDLAVVGVPAVEELNVRLGPGTAYDVVGRLGSLDQVEATGRNRSLPDEEGTWYEITADDGDLLGWVSAAFLGELGASREITDTFDRPPSSDTVNGLVTAVVDGWRAGATGPDGVLVGGPVTTTSTQVSIDVLEGQDDSVLGVRLLVVADRTDGGGYRAERVTLTQICARGVSAGSCV